MKNIFTLVFVTSIFALNAQVTVSTITGQFPGSGGVNLDDEGNVYIANFGDGLQNSNGTQIWILDSLGNLTEYATGFSGASGNDFDSEGNLFQSNIAAGNVSKVTPSGDVSLFVTDGISCPVGINIDADDNLYVCNCCGANGNTIRKVTPNGTSTNFSSSTLLKCPNGITRDQNNNLYVSNFDNGNIIKITPDGNASLFTSLTNNGFNGNNGHITYNENLNVLFAASHGTSKIYKIEMDGTATVIAGSGVRGNLDGNASSATFSRPNGIYSTVTGDTIYVNSSIPTSNVNFLLNPSILRMITGVNSITNTQDLKRENLKFEINPNPVSTKEVDVFYELKKSANVKIQIFDINGKVLLEKDEGFKTIGKYSVMLDIKGFLAGMYSVNLISEDAIKTRKLIVIEE